MAIANGAGLNDGLLEQRIVNSDASLGEVIFGESLHAEAISRWAFSREIEAECLAMEISEALFDLFRRGGVLQTHVHE